MNASAVQTGDTILQIQTKTIEFQYAYRVEGSIDGIPLFGNNSAIYAPRLPLPLPSTRWLEANRRGGFTVPSNLTEESQSFAIPVELFIPEFQNKFVFDPDVSITLLFDPNDNVAPEASDPGVIATTSVGLIVGLVVGGVVLLLAGTLFATVVFPYAAAPRYSLQNLAYIDVNSCILCCARRYMKKRNESTATEPDAELDEPVADTPQRHTNGWTKSKTPESQ
jgi:hypothetical protein